ncbi:MAG TPA: acetyl-CoA carboxylase carboxyltransferase subunit beta [Chloroflexota bacterium]|nr:acetyl-CoA carboxylase carboxyltransferase subunit beta [Chloroflexota bacterium]
MTLLDVRVHPPAPGPHPQPGAPARGPALPASLPGQGPGQRIESPAPAPSRGRRLGLRPDLWLRCENAACAAHLYVPELDEHLRVCPRCGHHFRLTAPQRIAQLVDPGSFVPHDETGQWGQREGDGSDGGGQEGPVDPLRFVSAGVSYRDKVRQAQRKTKLQEAVLCGEARLGGLPLELAVMDFHFLGGSMGTVVGERLVRTLDRAVELRRPVVMVSCSGGARMHEGLLSLMQMARTAAAVARLHQARLPLLSVLTDPTTGGVAASFAGLGDVLIAEPGALIGFAGPRVIEQVTHQPLPPGAQRAESLLARGMLDMVVQRRQLASCLASLLRLYAGSGAGSLRKVEPPAPPALSASPVPPRQDAA